jgi:two-component system, NarL family, sensor kinase
MTQMRPLTAAVGLSIAGSVVAFVALALGSLWMFHAAATWEAKQEAGRFGEIIARAALAPFLTDDLVAGEPEALEAIDHAGRALVEQGNASKLKVWSEEGQVLWADDTRMIGQYFDMEPQDQALFTTLGATVGVSDLTKDENIFDAADGTDKLLEVYFGAATSSGTPVVVETYYPYSFVTNRANDLRSRFLPLLIGALALLTLAQVPLAMALARRLHRYQRERERLLERVINASDAERRRIAAEVHDGAVQDLIGISYTLAAKADEAPSPLDSTLRALAASTRTTVRSLRSLLNSIYPVEVPEDGWAAGLDDLVQALRQRGVEVVLDVPRTRLAPVDELLLLRVTREALRNTASHADAKRVVVRLDQVGGRLLLEVKDDGLGFSQIEADTSRRDGHLGLQLLNDLASDVGGSLLVDSAPGSGTVVRLELVDHT